MRFLLEEDSLAVVGAFCVAAFTLAVVWTALELVVGLAAVPAGLVAFGSAGAAVEWISRRHYGPLRPAKPVRVRPPRLVTVDTPRYERAEATAAGRSGDGARRAA